MEKFVCKKHIDDKAIARHIKSNGAIGTCDYCKDAKSRIVLSLEDLADFIERSLYFLYDDAVEWLPYETAEGGYQGTTYDTMELLIDYHELETDPALLDDLIMEIPDHLWCDKDPFSSSKSEELIFDWKEFKSTLQHKIRYTVFLADKTKYFRFTVKVAKILDHVGKFVKEYKLFRQIPNNTPLYRCRQHTESVSITQAAEITSPPREFAIHSNRMSPAGVSMFYASFNPDVAVLETVDTADKSRPCYSIAKFSLKSDIWVIDLSSLPPVPSIFDERKRDHYHSLVFLRSFANDVSKPVNKDNKSVEHIEYIPTQTVTEYFRYILSEKWKMKIDGIIYSSSKKENEKSCALFFDHEESLEALTFDKASVSINKI